MSKENLTRRIGPVRAALLNGVGLGLGYVYVGRICWAFAMIALLFGLSALGGWLRLAFDPYALYLIGLLALAAWLFPMVHCALIASRNRSAPARAYNRWWLYLAWVIATWFMSDAVLALRPAWFGYSPIRIASGSMAPTLQIGDAVMADTWRYRRVEPAYGDLIVYRSPRDADVLDVKRVVGLPGDLIEIRDDVLIRNGEAIDEPYVRLTSRGAVFLRSSRPVVTPEGSYFLLGDNRHESRDSRMFGPVDAELLRGRIEHRWFAYRGQILWQRFPEKLAEEDG